MIKKGVSAFQILTPGKGGDQVVKIRLSRVGRKKTPIYRIVVADSRSPRDGKVIESIGRYDPREEPSLIEIDEGKARDWLAKGAQPTQTVSRLLAVKGIS